MRGCGRHRHTNNKKALKRFFGAEVQIEKKRKT
jgi:hypothetical protein